MADLLSIMLVFYAYLLAFLLYFVAYDSPFITCVGSSIEECACFEALFFTFRFAVTIFSPEPMEETSETSIKQRGKAFSHSIAIFVH